jgi:hypothetical protein
MAGRELPVAGRISDPASVTLPLINVISCSLNAGAALERAKAN